MGGGGRPTVAENGGVVGGGGWGGSKRKRDSEKVVKKLVSVVEEHFWWGGHLGRRARIVRKVIIRGGSVFEIQGVCGESGVFGVWFFKEGKERGRWGHGGCRGG